jgi:glutamate formiminotransferase/formiminotetrahydrofolate cyclodeaminase
LHDSIPYIYEKVDCDLTPLVECVPNFSEGRDQSKIQRIAGAVGSVEGVSLLDVDPGLDTNRTVMTFAGPPEAALEAGFRAIARAAELIDMSVQRGAHPRIGATDVFPFVPLSGVSMDDCAELARRLGKRVGDELGIPVFLYEAAASRPGRRNLADIRQGEYEGLPEKLAQSEWKPDFGPARFDSKAGAVVIGARPFLIAYNVNLNTRSAKMANEIAASIREKGRIMRDADGNIVTGPDGEPMRVPGKFRAVKAVGWYMESYGRAQVSINLTDHHQTPLHFVFRECCRLAENLGARVTGSELVGLIPLDAMLEAGRYFLRLQGRTPGVPEPELVHTAVLSLGLAELGPFDANQKIIEYRMKTSRNRFSEMPLKSFIDLVSSEAPAPGGGKRLGPLRRRGQRARIDGRRADARQERIRDRLSRNGGRRRSKPAIEGRLSGGRAARRRGVQPGDGSHAPSQEDGRGKKGALRRHGAGPERGGPRSARGDAPRQAGGRSGRVGR